MKTVYHITKEQYANDLSGQGAIYMEEDGINLELMPFIPVKLEVSLYWNFWCISIVMLP